MGVFVRRQCTFLFIGLFLKFKNQDPFPKNSQFQQTPWSDITSPTYRQHWDAGYPIEELASGIKDRMLKDSAVQLGNSLTHWGDSYSFVIRQGLTVCFKLLLNSLSTALGG